MKPLLPLELLYRAVTRLRRSVVRRGMVHQKRLPRAVVSVGNRSFGGSGKTPLTIAVAKILAGHGLRTAVLTRGYGRRSRDRFMQVDASDALRFGDEAVVMWLALRDHGIDVVVGSDRHAAGKFFLERSDCDLFLLDDGFQHLALFRDVDIVVEDPRARIFREGPSALVDADIVVWRGEVAEGGFAMELEPRAVVVDSRREPLSWLAGRRVAAFAGLARNEQFFEMLARLGADLATATGFGDHHVYSEGDLDEIERRARSAGAAAIVTTAKDRVKIARDGYCHVEVEAVVTPAAPFASRLLALLPSGENGRPGGDDRTALES